MRKAESGRSATVADSNLVAIDIPPAKQRLTYNGVALDDDAERLGRGVRTDDVIVLEFENPCCPTSSACCDRPPPRSRRRRGGGKEKEEEEE